MGGCAASRLAGGGGDEDDPVALCRDRKRLLKAAVDRRYALATAHSNYIHSLHAVAAAVGLFVARHSSPAPILITLPSPSPSPPASPSAFLRHTPAEPKTEAFALRPSVSSLRSSSPSVSSSGNEGGEEEEGNRGKDGGCGYFYAGTPMPPPPPPAGEFGWDFFNPFDGVQVAEEAAAMVGGLGRGSDEDLRVVREEEGIPELEEAEEEEEEEREGDEEKKVVPLGVEEKESGGGGEVGGGGGEEKGLTVTETPVRERDLLEALRSVEDHFIRAYDAGKEVSRMLEATRVNLQTGFDDAKENSSKIIQAITWHRTPSLSSSHKSHLASSSNSTSWTESKSDLFDDYSGMESGSHSQTLGRLYAWEKKLYEEVKSGDRTRQLYEKKCIQLRNLDAKGADSRAVDKTRAVVRDLHTRIWVALRAAESISERIEQLRDEELHPQLIELLQGLSRTWKIMLESHETQKQIMFEVNSFTCPAYGKFCNNAQRHATLKLEAELRNWRTCLVDYIAAQKAYVEALDGWLSKFIMPDVEFYSQARSSLPPYRPGAPPLIMICHNWSTTLGKLPDKEVSCAMRRFIKSLKVLWAKQGEEQQQKRKVDTLAKELDRRILAFQRAENKVLESKLLEHKPELDVRQRVEYLSERKELLVTFRKKLESEKAKHHDCMQDTHEITLNGFKIGLAGIFESLTDFSKDSLKLYNELLMQNDKAKVAYEMTEKPSCIGGSHSRMELDNR
ncbi:protein ROLLING AND ERECT LEAF 2-like [Phoenix dactylifera]|uniref:Protein ROLLING AND ERECT LEAF 2-like n=1 Tax=Phoenix dactylifera TaxID=42345 RepID=A0A8B8JAZ8_PHODC|nr:protein ROLLING AND ERECT LEAF 2-like [Phoenix dactylifera]